MSKFSSISVFGWSVLVTSENPRRSRIFVAFATLLIVLTLTVLLFPDIDEKNRMDIFPWLVCSYVISSAWVGKPEFQRHRSYEEGTSAVGNLVLFNIAISAIVIIAMFSRLPSFG